MSVEISVTTVSIYLSPFPFPKVFGEGAAGGVPFFKKVLPRQKIINSRNIYAALGKVIGLAHGIETRNAVAVGIVEMHPGDTGLPCKE